MMMSSEFSHWGLNVISKVGSGVKEFVAEESFI
jgi:hypothetical protein